MSSYAEKLRDPRWQRCRLSALEYYKWECTNCGASDKTLHVHHKIYRKGFEPWDYPTEDLDVLCKDCHAEEHVLRKLIAEAMADDGIWLSQVYGYAQAMLLDESSPPIHLLDYAHAAGIGDYFGISPDDIIGICRVGKSISYGSIMRFKDKEYV